MIDKRCDSAMEAMTGVRDGATVLIGGFGDSGTPLVLLEALIEHGARDLVVVSNNAGSGHYGLAALIETGNVRKVVCTYPRTSGSVVFDEFYNSGRIELEMAPQGTMAERIRAAGAGIGAFYTPTAAGTDLAQGKETRVIDGREHVLEFALHGDVALIKAQQADRWGNLTYRWAGQNFAPIMATAAALTIAQVGEFVALGDLHPERVVTPGVYVDHVVVEGESR
jgi:3-oxoadipate CoA-transferase, alpha subunit